MIAGGIEDHIFSSTSLGGKHPSYAPADMYTLGGYNYYEKSPRILLVYVNYVMHFISINMVVIVNNLTLGWFSWGTGSIGISFFFINFQIWTMIVLIVPLF